MPIVECVECGQPFYLPMDYRDYKGTVRCEHCGKLLWIKFVKYKLTSIRLHEEIEQQQFAKPRKRRKLMKLKRRLNRR